MARETGEEHIALDHSQRTDAYTGLIETRLALLEYARLPKKKPIPHFSLLCLHMAAPHTGLGLKGNVSPLLGRDPEVRV